MAHVHAELARDRQRRMLAVAVAQRDGKRAWEHGRISRKAERAERRQLSHSDQAARLRAELEEMESGS